MHGNRDFLVGEAFARKAGLSLLAEPTIIQLNGSSTLLLHGDSLCKEDSEYVKFRSMVRSATWQDAFLSKPLDERTQIARELREKSKAETSNKAEYITDVTQSEVEKTLLDNQCALLIHGHTHRPAQHTFKVGGAEFKRMVLGDWDENGWFIESSRSGMELKRFITT